MITGPGLDITLYRAAVKPAIAELMFDRLLDAVDWAQDEITMFGRTIQVPRLSAWYGDPGAAYTYSGIALTPLPWIPELTPAVELAAELALCSFNSVLINRYRNGRDSVGWHSDDEPELGANPVIASLSLGATRVFRMRRRDNHTVQHRLELNSGDLVVMRGATQRLWAHQVPKTAKPVGERINLTFRTVIG